MANKTLFSSSKTRLPRAEARNKAGGCAYQLEPKHALAQVAATGTFGNTFYSSGQTQLSELLALIDQVDDNEYLARLAMYSREKAYMKDLPAALLVALSHRDNVLMHRVFDRVVDNGRILRTMFQMIRSGQFKDRNGKTRIGLSSSVQRAFRRWLNEASTAKLLSASIGKDPSLRDILRMARPTPKNNQRRALFGWLTDKEPGKWAPATLADLPEEVQALIAFRRSGTEGSQMLIADGTEGIRWDLMAGAALGPKVWSALARKMGPQALRMNLNTLMRHGVFRSEAMVDLVAKKLADESAIRRSRQFPYQFFAAYLNVSDVIPHKIKSALHAAAEIACGNVPKLPGPVVIGLDTSGSMTCSVTGFRGRGMTSKMTCVDIAALFAAAILRRNPDSVVIPFDTKAYRVKIDPSDSILSIATRLSKYGGGGTNCALPLEEANSRFAKRKFAGAVLVSDNQSWIGNGQYGSTGVMTAWEKMVRNQRRLAGKSANPKLVCIDIQPYQTTQAVERSEILNVGGFSDSVFGVIEAFIAGDGQRFVAEVDAMEL